MSPKATGANIFFVKDGGLHTPTPDCFLNGITRQSVIELAKARQIPVLVRHIEPKELIHFTECFITGSAAEVTPVSRDRPLPLQAGDADRNADDRLCGRSQGRDRHRLKVYGGGVGPGRICAMPFLK